MTLTRAAFFRSLFLAPGAAIAAADKPANLPLISDATDPSHDWSLNVRLDGKTPANCARADAVRGIVWCYKTGADGQVIIDPKTRDVVLEARFGHVEIYRMRKDEYSLGWRGSSARYHLQGII